MNQFVIFKPNQTNYYNIECYSQEDNYILRYNKQLFGIHLTNIKSIIDNSTSNVIYLKIILSKDQFCKANIIKTIAYIDHVIINTISTDTNNLYDNVNNLYKTSLHHSSDIYIYTIIDKNYNNIIIVDENNLIIDIDEFTCIQSLLYNYTILDIVINPTRINTTEHIEVIWQVIYIKIKWK